MTNVLIVYATDWGSTQKMAEAVAAGVETVDGAKVTSENGRRGDRR